MTFAEVERAVESYTRVKKNKDRERAGYDYILADLIGRSISRVYNSSNKMPSLAEAYPNIFIQEEEQAAISQKQEELYIARFKQFADAYNKQFKEVSKANE